jgi:hypothetical protein
MVLYELLYILLIYILIIYIIIHTRPFADLLRTRLTLQLPFVPLSQCPFVPHAGAGALLIFVIFLVKLLYSQFFFVFLHAEDDKTVYCQ